jgi:hypothetical protein
MKATPLLNNLTAGEVDPRIDARVDVQKYYNAARIIENMIILQQGGAMRRPGTYFVVATKHSDKKAKLFNFSFSTLQGYILEIGNKYIRFFKDQGQIVVAYAAWLTGTAYIEGDLRTNAGSYYRCLVAHTSGTFATDLTALYWEATGGATDLAYEIPSPYLEADLSILKVVQSADVFFITHPSYAPRELSRTGHTTWTLGIIPFSYGDERVITGILANNPLVVTCANHALSVGDWVRFGGINGMTELNNQFGKITERVTNTFTIAGINSSAYTAYTSGGIAYPYEFKGTEIDIEGATAADPVVITATGHGIPDGTKILIKNVGGMVQLNDRVFITVSDGVNAFHLHDYAGHDVDGTGYTAYTSGGVICPTVFSVAGDFPGSIALFEQRMELSGSDNEPQAIYGSASGTFRMFDLGVVGDDSAFKYELATEKVDRVHWMMGQEYLMLGTPGGISRLGSSSPSEALTQTNVNVKKQATFGTKNCDAELVGDAILYVTRGGQTVREIFYTWNTADSNGGYRTTDLTILAGHIAKGATAALSGIVDSDQQQEPISIYWAVRADGQLLGMVYNREQQIIGWMREVTGRRSAVPTIDTIESVTQDDTDDGETVTLVITRTENTAADDTTWDLFESVAVGTEDDNEDEVWVIVNREIGGVTKRYIEYFKPHEFYGQLKDYFGVDSGLTFDGGAAKTDISGITKANPCVVTHTGHHGFTDGQKIRIKDVGGMTEINQGLTHSYTVANKTDHTYELSGINSSAWTTYTSGGQAQVVTNAISGMSHLEGRYIDIMIDGARHPQKLVSSGAVALSWYGNLIHAGLPFQPVVKPMKLEAGQSEGTAQGKKKRVYGLTVRFHETCTAKWGYDADHLKDVPFGIGAMPALFTGDVEHTFNGPVDTNGDIYITQSGPFPMTILAIMPKMETF